MTYATPEALLEFYLGMAKTPGWKSYAWRRAQEIAAQFPDYADLPGLLTTAMKEAADAQIPQRQDRG